VLEEGKLPRRLFRVVMGSLERGAPLVASPPALGRCLPFHQPHAGRSPISVAHTALGAHLGTVRRLLALAVAGAVAATSVVSATSAYCPAMRARALKHCCCPPGPSEAARLTCCTQNGEVSASASSAREQTERVQLVPLLVAADFSHPSGEPSAPVTTPARELLASAAGPPPVPLRI
jgi:hypothetical protein